MVKAIRCGGCRTITLEKRLPKRRVEKETPIARYSYMQKSCPKCKADLDIKYRKTPMAKSEFDVLLEKGYVPEEAENIIDCDTRATSEEYVDLENIS